MNDEKINGKTSLIYLANICKDSKSYNRTLTKKVRARHAETFLFVRRRRRRPDNYVHIVIKEISNYNI